MELNFAKPLDIHLQILAATMRQADVDEVAAATGEGPYDALVASVNGSHECYTALLNGRVACVFGVALPDAIGGGDAVIWMLGSDVLDDYPVTLVRQTAPFIKRWREQYSFIYNFIDVRNSASIKWVKWMGFTVHEPQSMGVNGEPFSMFTWRKD